MPTSAFSPSILVVGATGSTGVGAVTQLSQLLSSAVVAPKPAHLSVTAAPPRILALTRDVESEAAKKLVKLDRVKWQVFRVCIASHNLPTQFMDESRFLIACKEAKVEYLVKLSTNVPFITPDCPTYYGRAHWAVEQLLRSPEFSSMANTILRANVFTITVMDLSVAFIKANYPVETAADKPLVRLVLNKDAPIALVNSHDVEAAAGALLALLDPSARHGRTYNLSGPRDVTDEKIVRMIEAKLGEKLNVEYESHVMADEPLKHAPVDVAKSTKFPSPSSCGRVGQI
uniref:NmrA-like domain-containing protein n=1 Tax=Globisporangium ultimum (strain ATCC 200006 / CBS 805.95 / DAOM BR144) TaxID=431595 RepID=K3WQD3_GLOUD